MLVSPSLAVSNYGMYSCCGSGGLGNHYYCALSQIGGASFRGSAITFPGVGTDSYGRPTWYWEAINGDSMDFFITCLG